MDLRSHFVIVRRLTGVAVATALLMTTLVPAAAAQTPVQESSRRTPSFSTESIAKVVARTESGAVRLDRAENAIPKEAPKKQGSDPGFFRTRTGLLVIAIMAVGTGYAIYSANHDRIKGSAR